MPHVQRSVILLPNLAAEEGLPWRAQVHDPVCQRTARLWKRLFPTSSRILRISSDGNSPELGRGDEPAIVGLPAADAGVPWLATESAWKDLESAGLVPWGPTPEVVSRVHDKAFARRTASRLGLDPSPAGDIFEVFEAADLVDPSRVVGRIRSVLERWPAWARRSWTLKPRLGCSGRGRVPGFGYQIESPQFRGSLPRFADRGGAILEPFLDRTLDVSAQYFVHGTDRVELLGTLRQDLTVSGSYLGHEGVVQNGTIRAGTEFDDELARTSRTLVEVAAKEGFVGPCGVDAFAHRLGNDVPFRPCVELNARFTLGTIVIGLIRRAMVTSSRWNEDGNSRRRWRFQFDANGVSAEPCFHGDGVEFEFDSARLWFSPAE